MEINDDLLAKLEKLSRLKFEAERHDEIKTDLQKMLDFFDKIQKVDTTGVEPLIHLTEGFNRFRQDEPEQRITHAEALKNAPEADSDYFRVPKFVDNQ